MDYSNASFESFYEGGDSSLNPSSPFYTGFQLPAAQMGFPGSPQTANQLGETVNALKQGVKAFEVTALMPETAETIPKQHFQEMRALMKLSGVKPSVHGPLIDAAGFSEKGTWDGEDTRKNNENRMFQTLENARVLGPEGNIPVVFHSSNGAPGTEWKPGDESKGEDRFLMNRGAAVNRETGEVVGIARSNMFSIHSPESLTEGGTGELMTAEESIQSKNRTAWDKKLLEVSEMAKRTEEIIGSAPANLGGYQNAYLAGDKIIGINEEGKQEELPMISDPVQRQSYDQMRRGSLFIKNAELSLGSAFHEAFEFGDSEQKKALRELSENYTRQVSEASVPGKIWGVVERKELLNNAVEKLSQITSREYGGHAPEIFQEAGEFALDKAAVTFGNLAMKSWDSWEDRAPMIAIEPSHFGTGLSKTEELIGLVDKSRETFAKQLIEKKGFDEKKAKEIAEEKIGVTWDVGHANMMKKYGFEDKDVIEATRKIADKVKHVHLTDNFGHADTHLAPGMGNVPIKEILEELEKTGRLGEMRKIVESGAFVQNFKVSPFPLSLAAFGSPIYSMKGGPTFGQAMATGGNYFSGYGTLNPEGHHSMYGAGFTTMPSDLGGQTQGGASRFGGTPMA